MKTAVIYTCHLEGRISEPDNERQTMLCKEFAQQNGNEIVGSYMDCVITKHQPLLMKQQLFKDCQQKQWDMVLFSSITILGRRINDTIKFLSELSEYVDYKVIDQENDKFLKEVGKILQTLYKEGRL